MAVSGSIFVFVGVTATAATLVLVAPFVFQQMKRARLLDSRLAVPRREASRGVPSAAGAGSRGAGLSLRTLGLPLLRAGSILVPIGAREREKLTRSLRLAGFGRQDALSLFLSCKFVCSIVGAGLGALVGPMIAPVVVMVPEGALVAFAGLAGLVVGGIAPEYVLRSLMRRRKDKMAAALPAAIDLMVMCLESGLTFERSLATVADELTPIEPNLAGEFRLIDAELRLGSDRRAVLQAYYERTEVEGLRDLAMSLIQGDRYGTPLTQSMRNIAEGERVQRTARISAWAARLPVLMTLPMLLMVVPGTMLLIAGPAFISAMDALGGLGGIGGAPSGE